MQKIFFYFLFVFLFWYALFLRWYELDTGSFWIDEWYSSIIAYLMIQNYFLPQLWDGTFAFGQYFFHLFQALSFDFFWIGDLQARLPSFVFWIFHIVIFYFFAQVLLKESKYKHIGIIFLLFLFLFSTWQIIWSREARFYEMLATLYLLVTFLLYQYTTTKHHKYFLLFFIFLLIGIIFHQFFFAFLPIVFLIFARDFFQKKEWKIWLWIFLVFVWYILWQFIVQKIIWETRIISLFPNINSVQEYHFVTFFQYYIQVFFQQLWVVFLAYILGTLYFLFAKKHKEFLLFWGLFLLNIVVISFGYFAHSRYMFHLFSLITLLGWYFMVIFLSYIFEKYTYLWKKILVWFLLVFSLLSIFFSYKMTFIPQRFYYIDSTSPKPNFKNAYLFLQENYSEYGIISWFPHMCYWYNIENREKCEFALRVNLIGNSIFDEKTIQKQTENYTNVPYIENISASNLGKYVFILDDLTLKNVINKSFVEKIISNCPMIYRDVGNFDSANFIWIWKCQEFFFDE